MSPILGIYASSATPSHIVTSSYESISTVTVGSGGASSITFSSIPSTYTHLQLRGISRGTTAGNGGNIYLRFNSDTSSNYGWHTMRGDGASVSAGATLTQTSMYVALYPAANQTAGNFGAAVIDILDYTNTNKYKTVRSLNGNDRNGSGYIYFQSGLWLSTSAITRIDLLPEADNFAQYSSFALYGIKS